MQWTARRLRPSAARNLFHRAPAIRSQNARAAAPPLTPLQHRPPANPHHHGRSRGLPLRLDAAAAGVPAELPARGGVPVPRAALAAVAQEGGVARGGAWGFEPVRLVAPRAAAEPADRVPRAVRAGGAGGAAAAGRRRRGRRRRGRLGGRHAGAGADAAGASGAAVGPADAVAARAHGRARQPAAQGTRDHRLGLARQAQGDRDSGGVQDVRQPEGPWRRPCRPPRVASPPRPPPRRPSRATARSRASSCRTCATPPRSRPARAGCSRSASTPPRAPSSTSRPSSSKRCPRWCRPERCRAPFCWYVLGRRVTNGREWRRIWSS